MNEVISTLSSKLHSKNREYVLFLGAGFSKDAGLKTSWEILIDTLLPLYLQENVTNNLPKNYFPIIENWFLNHNEYCQLNYSEILELRFEGDIERRDYLKQFFVGMQPGKVHFKLAELIKMGFFRIVFTTNFDDLLEKALIEYNVDFDVISNDSEIDFSPSWDKVKNCRIYKLHGDYKQGKVRNTIKELEKLDEKMANDFQYIIDRHGIIVIGYAGRDKGIMSHFLERRPYSYPIYWQFVNMPEDNSEYLHFHILKNKYQDVYKRQINFIQNSSALNFLIDIENSINKLDNYLVLTDNKFNKYENIIIENNPNKIRATSIETINFFKITYNEYITKEQLDRSYDYKYEIFNEFLPQIISIFYYFNELAKFDMHEELNYFNDNIFDILLLNYRPDNEFIISTTPYKLLPIICTINNNK